MLETLIILLIAGLAGGLFGAYVLPPVIDYLRGKL